MENPVELSGSNPSTRQGRRLWWGFGVGGLLIAFMVGLLAWSSWHRQVQAIAEIERLGGRIVKTEPVGPKWLRSIVGQKVMAGYDAVVHVNLDDTQLTDAGMEHLKW